MAGVWGRTSVWLVSVTLAACGGGGGGADDADTTPTPAPPPSPPAQTPRDFVDVTAASNIDYRVEISPNPNDPGRFEIIQTTNGGAAAGDCNGDDLIDVFITSGDKETNRLYINLGNLTFEDRTFAAGLANTERLRHSGPTFADIDGDGDLDLFLGGLFNDSNKIYENQGDCTFVDVTPLTLVAAQDGGGYLSSQTFSAAFGDYDLDGDLDMFLTHWGTPDSLFQAGSPSETEHLWRNDTADGVISFVNVSMASGVSHIRWADREFRISPSMVDFGFTPTFARLDGDLWPDILLASDFGTTQAMINNGDYTFTAVHDRALRGAQWGMGSALGDIDNDGDLDWFVSSIYGPSDDPQVSPQGNRLFLNDFDKGLEFTDVTDSAGVADGSWGWGACFLDLDNDGDLDLFHTNGWFAVFYGASYLLDRSRAFINDGTGRFTEEGARLGLDADRDGRGVVCADFDNDGDVDILELTHDAVHSAILWENRNAAAGNNFLRVKLEGLPPNTEAAGARIFVTIGERTQMREIMIGSNYLSQNPTVQVFGLGAAGQVDELRVEWPAIAPGPGTSPVQPPDTIMTNVPAGVPGAPMVIRHPELP